MKLVDGLPAIELVELLERAALQHRLDRKYVVSTAVVERLVERLGDRFAHDIDRRGELTPEARAFLTECLARHYGCAPPPLRPTLSTSYLRATLADRAGALRVTLDRRLCCEGRGRVVHVPGDRLLVEVKSAAPDTDADRVLRALGAREVSVSKYCLAVALLDPRLPANRWSRVLRRSFAWERA